MMKIKNPLGERTMNRNKNALYYIKASNLTWINRI